MNYVPVNGLRLLVVEGCTLIVALGIVFAVIRVARASLRRPHWLDWMLAGNSRAVLLVIATALLGRALLLPLIGVPKPRINDEYSYLLMGDTFAHHRLTNPTPPSWQHFETFHVNLTPTYHSKYPVSQGLALAFGGVVFHQPWVGVYLSTALQCGAICWALQAFVPPPWAFLGGLLAVLRLALFSYWMNSYWGGSVAALGGAVALGAVVRLFDPGRTNRGRSGLACAFAIALLILATSRPYEGFAYSIPLLAYFAYQSGRVAISGKMSLAAIVLPAMAIGLAGVGLMGFYNKQTTGSPLLLPHLLNERTYSRLPILLLQKPKSDFAFRDPVFEKFFKLTEEEYEYQKTKSLAGLIGVESERFGGDWFFYVGPALSFPVLLGFLVSLKNQRLRIVVAVTCSTAIALAICIYTMPHYAAPVTVAVYIFAAEGLRYMWKQHKDGERAFVIAVCLTVAGVSLTRQTGSAAMNAQFAYPDARKLIGQQLKDEPGKQVVLVSYDLDRHDPGNELVHNGADFQTEKILWARSKGQRSDAELCQAYPDRTFWGVTTDDHNVSLRPLDLCK